MALVRIADYTAIDGIETDAVMTRDILSTVVRPSRTVLRADFGNHRVRFAPTSDEPQQTRGRSLCFVSSEGWFSLQNSAFARHLFAGHGDGFDFEQVLFTDKPFDHHQRAGGRCFRVDVAVPRIPQRQQIRGVG